MSKPWNAIPNNKPAAFNVPFVRNKSDRFCHFCGDQVRGIWPKCESADCQAPLKRYPPPPPGWSQCPTCMVGLLEDGDHFCRLCHFRTALGREWCTARNELNKEFKKQKAELNRNFGANAVRIGKRPCIEGVVGAGAGGGVGAGAGGGVGNGAGGGFGVADSVGDVPEGDDGLLLTACNV